MTWFRRYNPNKNPPQKINTKRFFCGLIPVLLISKEKEDGVNARNIYPIQKHHRTKIRYVYQAMTTEEKWNESDIILLPPGLCFGGITPRYFNSSNPKTAKRIEYYKKRGWILD